MTVFILVALVTSLLSSISGWMILRRGRSVDLHSLCFGVTQFVALTYALVVRGQARGGCPLQDWGEQFVFLAWSLSLFFILTGGVYRRSLLGLFTMPAITLMLAVTFLPSGFSSDLGQSTQTNFWKEAHAATSVLSYGAFGLGAVAGVMFLVLDRFLKAQKSDWLSMKMPPMQHLIAAMYRLLMVGVVVLTVGIFAGWYSHLDSGWGHFIIAAVVWGAYFSLLIWTHWKGMPPRAFAYWVVGLFLFSCSIFFIL